MTNDGMTELWELANSSFDDLKNTCKKDVKLVVIVILLVLFTRNGLVLLVMAILFIPIQKGIQITMRNQLILENNYEPKRRTRFKSRNRGCG